MDNQSKESREITLATANLRMSSINARLQGIVDEHNICCMDKGEVQELMRGLEGRNEALIKVIEGLLQENISNPMRQIALDAIAKRVTV